MTYKINSYSFGNITISNQTYNKDLIVYPSKIESNWWREDGHNLSIKDIQRILKYKPEILVIGCGSSGVMQVPTETLDKLDEMGIKHIEKNTGEAVEIFNQKLKEGINVVGAFHLTC
ncbi:hypothetical protein GF362_05035 [Candidatus Dojkabacteria bacterium]|nr:hypothetical protein [Candidatus Dojkabacteria bacterium]